MREANLTRSISVLHGGWHRPPIWVGLQTVSCERGLGFQSDAPIDARPLPIADACAIEAVYRSRPKTMRERGLL